MDESHVVDAMDIILSTNVLIANLPAELLQLILVFIPKTYFCMLICCLKIS